MDRADLLEFWRAPAPEGSWPSAYIYPVWRSAILLRRIRPLVPAEARILEVGCNSGRNLAYLADHRYANLEGLEISSHAVRLLSETYPQLTEMPVHVGAAEDVLPRLDGPYDLIFSLAVLEHIHPDGMFIIVREMARLTDQVLAIEPTFGHESNRQYPHDLETLFGKAGMTLVSEDPLHDEHPDFHDYSAWYFRR